MEEVNSSSTTPSPKRSRSKTRHRSNESSSRSPRHVKSIVTSMLKQQTFIGQYKATQRVDCIGDYRDVIEIEENDPLVPILTSLRVRIREAYPQCWPGITMPGDLQSRDGHCFWVQHADQLFEPHHYRIIDVHFKESEVHFVIQAEGRVVQKHSASEQDVFEMLNTSKEMIEEQSKKFALGLWALLTMENAKNTVTFLGVLVATLGAAGVYLMEYFIKLMHEMSGLVKVSMPAILKVLDIVQKVIGGLFVLVAMIWRDCLGANQRRPDFNTEKKRYLKD